MKEKNKGANVQGTETPKGQAETLVNAKNKKQELTKTDEVLLKADLQTHHEKVKATVAFDLQAMKDKINHLAHLVQRHDRLRQRAIELKEVLDQSDSHDILFNFTSNGKQWKTNNTRFINDTMLTMYSKLEIEGIELAKEIEITTKSISM